MNVLLAALLFSTSALTTADLPPAPIEPAAAERKEIEQQIQNLGHSDFAIRDTAYRKLSEFSGHAYRQLLEAERNSPDVETRHRCSLLIPAARLAHVKARIDAYLADVKGEYRHDLPGLERFNAATKDLPTARKTFAEMVQNPSTQKLLLLAEADPSALPAAVVSRAIELQNRQFRTVQPPPPGLVIGNPVPRPVNGTIANGPQPTLNEILGMFFFDSLSPKASQTRRTGVGPTAILNQPILRDALVTIGVDHKPAARTDDTGRISQAIIAMWFDSREEAYEINVAMSYASQFEMPDAVIRAATKQLSNKTAIQYMRGNAVTMLTRYGKEKSLPVLETLLNDETPAGVKMEQVEGENGQFVMKQHVIQTRDLALTMILNSKGIKLADYGIKTSMATESMKYQPTNYWFPTEDDRKKAFLKWTVEKDKEQSKK